MYLRMIILTMGALPILSIGIEFALTDGSANLFTLTGKWLVFWAVGIRLLLAGIKQIVDPAFTTETIFKIADKDARKIVVELGFGNVSIALLALLSLLQPEWLTPAAITSGLFYGLAGLQHVRNGGRTRIETIAMASDLFICIVMVIYLAAAGQAFVSTAA